MNELLLGRYKKIETGLMEKDKLQCVFLIIYCKNGKPHKKHTDIKNIPVVLTVNRWDGVVGFPGGKVDSGESLLNGLLREVKEELDYSKVDINRVIPLATFSEDWDEMSDEGYVGSNIHSFLYEAEGKELKEIAIGLNNKILNCFDDFDNPEDEPGQEITGYSTDHLYEYAEGKGLECLFDRKWKATAGLELKELTKLNL